MTRYILIDNILKDSNILTAYGRKGDKVDLLGSDGHTATVKRVMHSETFQCPMSALKPDTADDSFLSNELDLK